MITLAATPLTMVLARRVGAIDHPTADRPRVHKHPIPRIGGLAMVIGILVPALLLVDLHGPRAGIILAIPLWRPSGSSTTSAASPRARRCC